MQDETGGFLLSMRQADLSIGSDRSTDNNIVNSYVKPIAMPRE